ENREPRNLKNLARVRRLRSLKPSTALTIIVTLVFPCLPAAMPRAQPPAAGRGAVDPGVERLRAFDPAAVERGRTVFGEKCSSCDRANARGGEGFAGPDLIRSVLVLQDVSGRQIAAHLQSAHTPTITLAAAESADIGTFLHREVTYAAERTN